jgi:hypothetical protein
LQALITKPEVCLATPPVLAPDRFAIDALPLNSAGFRQTAEMVSFIPAGKHLDQSASGRTKYDENKRRPVHPAYQPAILEDFHLFLPCFF